MRVVLIGAGQAGGKITQAIAEFDRRAGFGAVLDAVAVNTASTDLQGLDIEGVLVGRDRVKGEGVGGDNELGAEVMASDVSEVMATLDGRITTEAEAIVVVAGLGGGTGSGGAPVLAKELSRVYDVPVYALGALPGRDEGAMYQANAGRSLITLRREADATILIDNDAWREGGEDLASGHAANNAAIAKRIGLLLAAGEIQEGDAVAESVVDASEVINTLREGGLAAVGYADAVAADDPEENVNAIASTVRRAVLTGTSLPDAKDAEAALVIAAGRPERLPRRGFERARSWVEEETGTLQVRGGDFPLDSDRIAAVVLLGGIERSDRVDEFLDRAREGQREVEAIDRKEALVSDELDDLF